MDTELQLLIQVKEPKSSGCCQNGYGEARAFLKDRSFARLHGFSGWVERPERAVLLTSARGVYRINSPSQVRYAGAVPTESAAGQACR